MKEPSAKRKRTLALHERALRFSVGVNSCCPAQFSNLPSKIIWNQLVRAADSTSNNLIEADDATSDADFLSKMGIALREVKESRAGMIKLRLGSLDHFEKIADLELESEATQLAAIFATIILNMRLRLDEERRTGQKSRKRWVATETGNLHSKLSTQLPTANYQPPTTIRRSLVTGS